MDEPIPLLIFRAIVAQVKAALPDVKTEKGVAHVVFNVWEKMHLRPPGAVATVSLLMVYLLAGLLTIPWMLPFVFHAARK